MIKKTRFRELFKTTGKPEAADQRFVRLVFFNVGHGACTLISLPPEKAGARRRYGVVDSNSAAETSIVESYLRHPPFPDEPPHGGETLRLDFAVLTHYDPEHFKGLSYLLGRPGSPFRVKHFLGPPFDPRAVAEKKFRRDSPAFEELCAIRRLAYVPTRRARRLGIAPTLDVLLHGVSYDWFDDVQIAALAPLADAVAHRKRLEAEGNVPSGALRFGFGTNHVLLMCGDVRERVWHEIGHALDDLANDPLLADVVMVPCHGASSVPLVVWERISRLVPKMPDERRTPTAAVISCRHMDPHTTDVTYDLLARNKCAVYCTNPTRACLERHERVMRRPPCLLEEIQPTENGAEPETAPPKNSATEAALMEIAKTADPLAGSVCVDLRNKSAPVIRHIGRLEKKDCLECWRSA